MIELLISFSIVTFLLLGTAQLALHSIIANRRADQSLKSAELASSKLEYFKSLPYESEELEEGSQAESLERKESREIFLREWDIEAVSPNMKKIEMESFSENYPHKKTRLVLFLSRELGF